MLQEQKEARLARVQTEGDAGASRRASIEKEYAIPENASALASTLRRFLLKLPVEQRVLIVLDALDQFDEQSIAEVLDWLPEPLPKQVRLIVSRKSGAEVTEHTLFGPRQHQLIRMDPLTEAERTEIIRQVPSLSAKTLDEGQIRLLLDNPACANPLFLRVAIEELRGYGSFEQLTRRILAFPGRKPGFFERVFRGQWSWGKTRAAQEPVTALFDQVLDRLEAEFDAEVVRAALTHLAVARRGLSERELKEIVAHLSGAEDLFAILRQLRPYLLNRAGLLNFYHVNLGLAVATRYLDGDAKRREAHAQLADYFAGQPYFLPGRVAHARKADELPWQLLQAARWLDLEALLTTLPFCESKAEAGLASDLADDFTMTNKALPGDPPTRREWDKHGRSLAQKIKKLTDPFRMRLLLPLLEEALRRDLPFLSRNPTALFQCLWNSCWWHDADEAAHHYERPRNGWGPDGPPWKTRLSIRLPIFEPKLSSLLEDWRAEKERAAPGFVWLRTLRPLAQRLGLAERTIFHGAPVAALACSADGKWLATAGGYAVKVWNARTGEERQSFEVGRQVPGSGELIEQVLANADESDAESQRELAALEERQSAGEEKAGCVAWSPDGARLVVGAGQTFYVFDVDNGTQILRFSVPAAAEGYTVGIEPCADFSPDGKRIVLAGARSACAQVVAADTGQTIFELGGHKSVSRVSYSPEGSRILTLGAEPIEEPTESEYLPTFHFSLCNWDAATGQELGRQLDVEFAEYSKDGRRLIFATAAEVVVFDAQTTHEIARHRDLQADRDQIVSTPKLQVDDGTFTFTRAISLLETMAISPDGHRFALADREGNVRVWDADTGALLACHTGDSGEASAIAFFPSNLEGLFVPGESSWQATNPEIIERRLERLTRRRLVCGFPDGTARIWNAEDAAHVPRLRRADGNITDLAFSPDGQFLATAAYDLCLWDAATGRELQRLDGHRFVAFDQAGQRVASAGRSQEEELQIWDAVDGRLLVSFPGHSAWSTCAAFSPDGLRLATGGADYTDEGSEFSLDRPRSNNVRVWDLQSGKEILCILAHEDDVLSVAFSPDGRRLASGGDNGDNTLKLWDAATGELLAKFPTEWESWWGIHVRDLAFSPDGRYLAFSSGSGLRVIDAQSGQLIEEYWAVGDTTVLAAGVARFPWCALRSLREDETVVLSAAGHKVAQFPARFDRIATHRAGRSFAGVIGRDLYLFVLESEDKS